MELFLIQIRRYGTTRRLPQFVQNMAKNSHGNWAQVYLVSKVMCAEKIIQIFNLNVTVKDFMKQFFDELELLFPNVQRQDRHKPIPMALATSSKQRSLDMKMENHKDLMRMFHHLTMGSSDPEVAKGKPDPAIFLVCASRFPDNPKPEDCLVFEDALNGVKAARAANMQVVVVPDPRIPTEQLKDTTLVLKSLEDFKPELFGLPVFDR